MDSLFGISLGIASLWSFKPAVKPNLWKKQSFLGVAKHNGAQ
jgi:hypothetical protein